MLYIAISIVLYAMINNAAALYQVYKHYRGK